MHNYKLLNREYHQTEHLSERKHRYEDQIKILRQSLPSLEEEQLSKIFEIESQVRALLEKDFPEKAKYQKLYDQRILPLVQEAKQSIVARPIHFAAQAAASKGKAVQASLQALKQLAENKPIVKDSKVSEQQVFLLPQEGAVFKCSNDRAKEEEEIINSLFDLMSKQAVVGTFNIQKASAVEFGIVVSPEVEARGFTPEALTPGLRSGIRNKLSNEDLMVLNKHEANPQKVDKALANYRKMEQQTWHVKLPDQAWKSISFKELQSLNLSHKLPLNTLVGTSPQKAIQLGKHITQQTPFSRALNYLPALHASPQKLYLSPDLSNPLEKQVYQLCEHFKWSYTDHAGNQVVVDFKTLHARSLQNEQMQNIQSIPIPREVDPTPRELQRALQVGWKIVSPELLQLSSGSLSQLSDIQAKPFISEMILMKNLDAEMKKAVLNRLTPNAEVNAILTGEVQLLDLHAGNLGIAPKPNEEYERFKNITFIIPSSGKRDFKDLLQDYLKGNLPDNTMLIFQENGKKIHKPLRDLSELQKALNVSWEFVIFDTDLSLTEDNRLQLQTRHSQEQHLIPFRSVLLTTDWKDKPLSDEAIQELFDSEERDLRVKHWIAREDAPIYKQLSATVKEELAKKISPIVQKYSLSTPRKNHKNVTMKDLQDRFVDRISDLTNNKHQKIWKIIERDLSSVKVLPQDTWQTIAKRYHQDEKQLRKLNPQGIQPGGKLKIQYDLTSHSPNALKKRHYIASQLFPRLTFRQQTALLERQGNRKNYLNNYKEFSHSHLKGEQLFTQMQQFLQQSTTPLSSIRREELLKILESQKKFLLSNPQEINKLKQQISDETQPTYFNLMKTMYPLLADAYALNMAVYAKSDTAGMNIGLYSRPLESTIAKAKAKFNPSTPEGRLAQKLENQISSIKNPAFFGHWQ